MSMSLSSSQEWQLRHEGESEGQIAKFKNADSNPNVVNSYRALVRSNVDIDALWGDLDG